MAPLEYSSFKFELTFQISFLDVIFNGIIPENTQIYKSPITVYIGIIHNRHYRFFISFKENKITNHSNKLQVSQQRCLVTVVSMYQGFESVYVLYFIGPVQLIIYICVLWRKHFICLLDTGQLSSWFYKQGKL